MAFWFGGLLIEGSLLVWSSGGAEGHNRRPPHQKATTPEGTTPEGHHTRRPPHQKATTPEGHNRKGVPGGDTLSGTATAVDGMHPTGMHSC